MAEFSNVLTEKFVFGDITIGSAYTVTNGLLIGMDVSVAGASTDLQHFIAIDVSAVKLFVALCDRDITLETNSGGSPANTLSLTAAVPYVWRTGKADSFKLTTDVTSIFATLAAGDPARLQIQALVDPTP